MAPMRRPIVARGVMYTVNPGGGALRSTPPTATDLGVRATISQGDGRFRRRSGAGAQQCRDHEDMICFLAHDGAIVALDAKDWEGALGQRRQNFKEPAQATSSPTWSTASYHQPHLRIRADCFLRRMTRKPEKTRFYNTPAEGSPVATRGARFRPKTNQAPGSRF